MWGGVPRCGNVQSARLQEDCAGVELFWVRVEEPGQLGAALASGQPVVVDVVIDLEDSD